MVKWLNYQIHKSFVRACRALYLFDDPSANSEHAFQSVHSFHTKSLLFVHCFMRSLGGAFSDP